MTAPLLILDSSSRLARAAQSLAGGIAFVAVARAREHSIQGTLNVNTQLSGGEMTSCWINNNCFSFFSFLWTLSSIRSPCKCPIPPAILTPAASASLSCSFTSLWL